jgi:two-component system sensor histidine kinase QseC
VSYEGYRWRTFTHFDEATAHWVIVAERIDMRFVLAEEVILSAVLPIILSLPLIGFLIWIILGRGLNPLAQLAALLREKKPQDLSPIEQNNNPKELAQLVNSTNELLARLGGSLDREKRFSGDAAHELRTPLSALKVHAFNLSKQLPANDESINMLNLSIDRMAHLIEQMLILYRTTPDQFVARFEQLDLEQLVQSVVISMYPRLEAKQQSISLESEQCFILADRFAIETLVSNILDNSNKYTGEGGEVKMFIQTDSENAILVVEDSGVGISPSLYGRVLERFYRVNGDQHDSDVIGCGLGFSIIQHIIELHSGAITLAHSSFDTGLKVTVLIPKEKR